MAVTANLRDSADTGLAVIAGQAAARSDQAYALVVAFIPPPAKLVRDDQSVALVPLALGNSALPRVSEQYAVVVYSTAIPNERRNRCWTFSLDGHQFYILDLGPEGTWAFDQSTRHWSRFITTGYKGWNVKAGTMWQQARIVGGDATTGYVWEVDPNATFDEGWRDISHLVTGGLLTRSRVYRPVYSVNLTGSVSLLDDAVSTVSLRMSDDNGVTWSPYYTITLTDLSTQELAWRSMGSFASPGRVFEVSDVGGLVRIDGLDAAITDFDDTNNDDSGTSAPPGAL